MNKNVSTSNKLINLVLLGFLVCGCTLSKVSLAENSEHAIENLRSTSKAFASVAKKVSPSVVNIQVESQISGDQIRRRLENGEGVDPFSDEFFKFFFSRPFQRDHPSRKQIVIGQGSGFIISHNGYIITNSHVVKDASKIIIKLQDNRELEAKIIGMDSQSDLAVIKIAEVNLPVLELGDSDKLEVGEWVLALGNPFGLSHTLTAGIVSAKGRSGVGITDYENFIQTDAAINPGNSGGPLVNLEGKVVGINTAIVSQNGGYMGIGFAIPTNMAKQITDQLINKGSVSRGYFGVSIQEITEELAKSFNLKENEKGILVAQVLPNSPASKCGIKQADVILELDGKPVKSTLEFRNTIALSKLGSKHSILVLRDGVKKKLTFVVSEKPKDVKVVVEDETEDLNVEKLGIAIKNLPQQLAENYGLETGAGVVITEVFRGSIAEIAGLKPGMVILEVNRKPVANSAEFMAAINQAKDEALLFLIQGRHGVWYLSLKP